MKCTQTPIWVMATFVLSCHVPSHAGVAQRYHQSASAVQSDAATNTTQAVMQSVSALLQPLWQHDKDKQGYRWIETNEKHSSAYKQNTTVLLPQRLALKAEQTTAVERVVAPNGMFRRAEGAMTAAPTLSNGAYIADNRAVTSDHNLLLTANVPMSIPLADAEVLWQVRPVTGGQAQRLQGRALRLSLPDGQYDITLMVGGYEEQRVVDVHYGRLAVADFAANIGVLRVASDVNADWEVFALQSGKAMRQVLSRGNSNELSVILPVGEYEVVAHVDSAQQQQRLRVERGTTQVTAMNVPTGKVNLVATLGNAPAMRPMQWKLYRLDGSGRHEIAAPARHSVTLAVPPGHYEAVANLDGRERRREFTVLDGTSNSVVLAMD